MPTMRAIPQLVSAPLNPIPIVEHSKWSHPRHENSYRQEVFAHLNFLRPHYLPLGSPRMAFGQSLQNRDFISPLALEQGGGETHLPLHFKFQNMSTEFFFNQEPITCYNFI